MNITFFTDNMSKGGAQRVISVLCNYFCSSGHSVSIILRDDIKEIAYKLDEKIGIVFPGEGKKPDFTLLKGLRTFTYKCQRRLFRKKADIFEEKLSFKIQADYLASYLQKHPTDILISFLVKPNIIAGLAARRIHARVVAAERNYPDRAFEAFFVKLRNSCYAKADVCVFQTKEQADMFPKSVQRKSVVIPNPVKDDLPAPHIGKRNKVIVNYCGYKEHKNISLLIDAYSIIVKKHPDYLLEVYGYGEQKELLQKKIEGSGLSEKAILLPFESNIHEKVKRDAMFVMTSDYEGMPNALIEAMAIGMPVVSTDCLGGGAKAVIENGINGILVPAGDKNALVGAIGNLIENPDEAEKLGVEAQKIREKLSINNVAKLWTENVLR